QAISNQDLQIFYQMAINGTRDMSLAPSEQIGFEMTLLRMLAFHSDIQCQNPSEKKTLKIKPSSPTSNNNSETLATEKEAPKEVVEAQVNNALTISSQEEWETLSQTLNFSGGAKMLVKNTLFTSFKKNTLTLTLDEQFANLLSDHIQKNILESLKAQYPDLALVIDLSKLTEQTLAQKETQAHNQYLATIQQEFLNDEIVQQLEQIFNAKVDINSIKEITKH
ncbi:MAG: DNA polymerase III subunit gamma/tau, partial [Proteobacteria bacterium]|nr:DNA polymerase III subunit gamma/tau [Pseudomonadota bacterium]